jgi:hypothetical protein
MLARLLPIEIISGSMRRWHAFRKGKPYTPLSIWDEQKIGRVLLVSRIRALFLWLVCQ